MRGAGAPRALRTNCSRYAHRRYIPGEPLREPNRRTAPANPALSAGYVPLIQRYPAKYGETKSSVVIDKGVHEGRRFVLNADLRVVNDDQFPFALNYFTGSKEHNVAMRQRAIQYGLKLNEYELVGPKKSIACHDEADIYKALDLD